MYRGRTSTVHIRAAIYAGPCRQHHTNIPVTSPYSQNSHTTYLVTNSTRKKKYAHTDKYALG